MSIIVIVVEPPHTQRSLPPHVEPRGDGQYGFEDALAWLAHRAVFVTLALQFSKYASFSHLLPKSKKQQTTENNKKEIEPSVKALGPFQKRLEPPGII